jgi:putative protease
MKKPELLAPGGSFLSAYYAFQAGADGVYLGLQEFSARKAAANFTPEQRRRLVGVARERGGRVYLTLNTVVREAELGRAAESLYLAEELGLDGVIVQDLGIAELARRHFPSLALHASTQMAVHDSAGLRVARELGFRRVILSRELDLPTLRALRRENPDIELEVFVHGALCYSFSGLCLASWALTGRSGNRGDCAQICRSLFRSEDGEGFFFSSRDLYLGKAVLELAAIGIDALKIEGRMKGPEYVFHTVKLYRAILDRGDELPAAELEELERRSALGFARERTRAYLRNPRGERLIDAEYPGHRGALLGSAEAVREGWAALRLQADLSLRDGLQYFPAGGRTAARREPVQFSVQGIRRAGREVPFARRGESVEVRLPEATRPPGEGEAVFQLSSRFLDLPQPKQGGFRPWRRPCAAAAELRGSPGADAELRVRLELPDGAGEHFWQTSVPLERASSRRPFAPILAEVFAESGDCLLTLEPLDLVNQTGLPDDALFVPPSALKKARVAFYRDLEQTLEERRREYLQAVADDSALGPEPRVPTGPLIPMAPSLLLERAARRQELAPFAQAGEPAPHPFADGSAPPQAADLAEAAGFRFLPLAPVARGQDPARWVGELLDAHPEQRFAVGLSNLAHLELARRLAGRPNAFFFADFHLYAANRFTVGFLARRVPGLLYATHWLEGSEEDARALQASVDVPLVRLEAGFRPPLFYGLSCPRGQEALRVGGRTGCRDCPGGFDLPLAQGRNRFHLRVRGCTAYLYALTPSGAAAARGTAAEG